MLYGHIGPINCQLCQASLVINFSIIPWYLVMKRAEDIVLDCIEQILNSNIVILKHSHHRKLEVWSCLNKNPCPLPKSLFVNTAYAHSIDCFWIVKPQKVTHPCLCFSCTPAGIVLSGSNLAQTSAITSGDTPKHAIHLLWSLIPSRQAIFSRQMGWAASMKQFRGINNLVALFQ